MFSRAKLVATLGCAALSLTACATPETTELGEAKQEFESVSQGGLYRFQYVAEGSDGYRTVLWRQGESLSDDGRDGALVAGVVKAVFKERFCSDFKLPATLEEGSPRPMGQEGKWSASLRCAEPPKAAPKPKPEKKKEKPQPKPVETADPAPEKPADPPAEKPERSAQADEPKAAAPKAKKRVMDGPMECVARKSGDGFDCRPLGR